MHPTLVPVVARLAALHPRPELSLTTNGVSLTRSAAELVAAGLDRINVSLDTLDRERFAQLTRRDRLDDVLAGIAAAAAAGITPVKINTVLVRDSNLAEAPALLEWALRAGYQLRFIEHMPLDADHTWSREGDGHRRRDPRPAGGGLPTRAARAPRQRAGRGVRRPRRARTGRSGPARRAGSASSRR